MMSIARIAKAASSTEVSRVVVYRSGNYVWSMISTDHPSAWSQIVRVGRPATFIVHAFY